MATNNKGISQNTAILNYLQSGHSITPVDALNKFGCFRLGARIYELRKRGFDISSARTELPNGKIIASYSLKKAEAAKNKVSQATAQAAAPANVDTETGEVKEDNQPKKQ